ncbi:sensor histidine kinase [Janibacter endophyticus]|uniref:sensor histidine kinase n=1 Tax=Janibacter endophyticus TaxID=2806261 RepID=UPI0027DBFA68|nr:histidine kinase N-terminal domain-containing protein [Janibacter endophyticus]
MPSTPKVLAAADLATADVERARLILEDWQLLADLGFSDLVMWVLVGERWVAAAHARPMTGPMAFVDDLIGTEADVDLAAAVSAAADSGHVLDAAGVEGAVRVWAVPVRGADACVCVVTRHQPAGRDRGSPLEVSYGRIAEALSEMLAAGDWPSASAPTGQRRGAPRVGDGVIELDERGVVLYASPNAVSALRRLGHHGPVIDAVLAQAVGSLETLDGPLDEGLALVLMGRAAWRAEVTSAGAAATLRAVPIIDEGRRTGAVVLVRDVSDLRYREGELLSKDETIREVHHRVKNNLQTVAALLRMQSRRVEDGAGKTALLEAVRRVGVIALVYETLSTGFHEEVDFDEIGVRGLRAVIEVARTESVIDSRVEGSFGWMGPNEATSVALIVSELVQNAVEHGVAEGGGGRVVVTAERVPADGEDILRVSITDDGAGLPAGFRPSRAGLGTRIVTSMVQDLRGTIRWEDAEPKGTRVTFSVRLRQRS